MARARSAVRRARPPLGRVLLAVALAAFAGGFCLGVTRLQAAPGEAPPKLTSRPPLGAGLPQRVPTEAQPAAQKRRAATVAMRPAPAASAPRAAIIIDDCGNNWRFVEGFVNAPVPLTLAVLPHLMYSRQIANEAHKAGKGVILHFPMEAVGGQNPGPGTLSVAMNDAQMRDTIERNLASVPHLEGVNNHEGSQATADERVMTAVLGAVKTRGLYFVDSYTTFNSRADVVARRLGLPFARRDVFLDNEDDVEAIKTQLRVLINEAETRGSTIGIGHAKSAMLTALMEMLPAFEEAGVRLVLARELVRNGPSKEAVP
jgi:polysaccharide deacetylase 2 family uncharacterized protein YibQ